VLISSSWPGCGQGAAAGALTAIGVVRALGGLNPAGVGGDQVVA